MDVSDEKYTVVFTPKESEASLGLSLRRLYKNIHCTLCGRIFTMAYGSSDDIYLITRCIVYTQVVIILCSASKFKECLSQVNAWRWRRQRYSTFIADIIDPVKHGMIPIAFDEICGSSIMKAIAGLRKNPFFESMKVVHKLYQGKKKMERVTDIVNVDSKVVYGVA